MSRRDTIILAVLINASLLSILFFTATRPDAHTAYSQPSVAKESAQVIPVASQKPLVFAQVEVPVESLAPSPSYIVREEPVQITPVSRSFIADAEPVVQPQPLQLDDDEFAEVTVKRGDFLEKIARVNGTTVTEIKRLNNLSNDRIDIGQVLIVPARKEVASPQPTAVAEQRVSTDDADYYTIKSGDNPWNIARQYRVNFDELLRLNNLDEAKARNLKPGDKIRVK